MKIKEIVIRCILTLALLYGAYTETGIWTTLSLLLIFLNFEIVAYNTTRNNITKQEETR